MIQKEDIERLIAKNGRRLQKLQEAKANFGLHTPPHILIEIEDIESEITILQAAKKQVSQKDNQRKCSIVRSWDGKKSLEGIDLSGCSLPGIDLYNAYLKKANLVDVDLRQARLRRASLEEADLRGANLSGADLSYAELYNTRLTRANLSEAELVGTELDGAYLGNANLFGANLERASLIKNGKRYGGTMLILRTNLQGADLRNVNFTDATLQEAILTRSDLRGANLSGANLSGVDLTGAKFDSTTKWPDGYNIK